MAKRPGNPELTRIDAIIAKLTAWLQPYNVAPDHEQLGVLQTATLEELQAFRSEVRERFHRLTAETRARAMAVMRVLCEFETFASKLDPLRGFWCLPTWFVPLCQLDEVSERLFDRHDHEVDSNVVIARVWKELRGLDALANCEILPLEKKRVEHGFVPKGPPKLHGLIEGEAERVVDATLAARKPLLLAAARQAWWAPGFRSILRLAQQPNFDQHPACTMAQVARALLAVAVDGLAALGDITHHASDISPDK